MDIKQCRDHSFYTVEDKSSCGIGLIADLSIKPSHRVITDAAELLTNLSHRGAIGADPLLGDGAGITFAIPDEMLRQSYPILPSIGDYGVGMFFFYGSKRKHLDCLRKLAQEVDCDLLDDIEEPIDIRFLSSRIRDDCPNIIKIIFIPDNNISEFELNKRFYKIRIGYEKWLSNQSEKIAQSHIVSLSSRIIIYKALVIPEHLSNFYLNLKNPTFKSHFALIHSRYSTNTLPTWSLVQPCQFLAHNGEINTLKGAINGMKSIIPKYNSNEFGKTPIIFDQNQLLSDSMWLNKWVEFLYYSGKSLAEIFSFCLPQSNVQSKLMSDKVRAFFRYHAAQVVPWSGPAGIVYTDGVVAGACLDRFGLRPLRYQLFKDDYIVIASEVGVLRNRKADIKEEGRLGPSQFIQINLDTGELSYDDTIKQQIAEQHRYVNAVKGRHISLPTYKTYNGIEPADSTLFHIKKPSLNQLHAVFGYSKDCLKMIFLNKAVTGKELVYSMGSDVPIAIFSYFPKRLFDYFKQRFAQVSNPALDSVRESIHLSIKSFLGPKHSIFDDPIHQKKLYFYNHSILSPKSFDLIFKGKLQHLSAKRIDCTEKLVEKAVSFKHALKHICNDVDNAIHKGNGIIILSDRNISKNQVALPSLLVCSTVHNHLLKTQQRHKVSLVIESGEVFESHQVATLFGYGANAIYPYLAFITLNEGIKNGYFPNLTYQQATFNFIKAMDNGLLKIMSKLGIPTLRGYIGSEQFDILGLNQQVVSHYFKSNRSLIGGLSLKGIEREVLTFHQNAFGEEKPDSIFERSLGGLYKFRKGGEFHAWNPQLIVKLQKAVRTKSYDYYKSFSDLCDEQTKSLGNIRGFFRLKLKKVKESPINRKDIRAIVKTLSTGAMSFGALSPEAHKTLAEGMNRVGAYSNSGEGGELAKRLTSRGQKIDMNSKIKQVASGRFGVYSNYLISADIIQIKIAQGAKPGEGGQIPGHKVIGDIAAVRFTKPGTELISPPPHHDIYSIEDLKQLIHDLKCINPKALISVKLVAETGVGTIAVGVAKAKADIILISGYDGGTGASLIGSIHQAGLPWEIGLIETHQALSVNGLRDQVQLHVDGGFKTARDIIIAAIFGAQGFGFSTTALVTLGCVMVRQCHKNTCPTGIATQDPDLRKLFKGNADHIEQWTAFLAQDVALLLRQLKVNSLKELINRVDLLEFVPDKKRWKTKGLNFHRFFFKLNSTYTKRSNTSHPMPLDHKIYHDVTANQLEKVYEVTNSDRTVAANLVYKESINGLKKFKPFNLHFKGYAGQSFGAFLSPNFHLHCEGGANDYVGKSLSGGTISIRPYKSTQNNLLLIGNACFYGAIKGNVFIAGAAGERFAVRNSGATLVVEGMGDHGCEYMTGGTVVCLGPVGLNFAAGMSGGKVFILDKLAHIESKLFRSTLTISKCNLSDLKLIKNLLKNHYRFTKSQRSKQILSNWVTTQKEFYVLV